MEKSGAGLLVGKALRGAVIEIAAAPSGHAHRPFKSSWIVWGCSAWWDFVIYWMPKPNMKGAR